PAAVDPEPSVAARLPVAVAPDLPPALRLPVTLLPAPPIAVPRPEALRPDLPWPILDTLELRLRRRLISDEESSAAVARGRERERRKEIAHGDLVFATRDSLSTGAVALRLLTLGSGNHGQAASTYQPQSVPSAVRTKARQDHCAVVG